jgi:hypothetical protein
MEGKPSILGRLLGECSASFDLVAASVTLIMLATSTPSMSPGVSLAGDAILMGGPQTLTAPERLKRRGGTLESSKTCGRGIWGSVWRA